MIHATKRTKIHCICSVLAGDFEVQYDSALQSDSLVNTVWGQKSLVRLHLHGHLTDARNQLQRENDNIECPVACWPVGDTTARTVCSCF